MLCNINCDALRYIYVMLDVFQNFSRSAESFCLKNWPLIGVDIAYKPEAWNGGRLS